MQVVKIYRHLQIKTSTSLSYSQVLASGPVGNIHEYAIRESESPVGTSHLADPDMHFGLTAGRGYTHESYL